MRGLVRSGAEAQCKAGNTGRWSDLRKRTLSAVVLAPVVLGCIWFGGLAWVALMGVAAIGLGVEWAGLCGRGRGGWWWLAGGVVYLGAPLLALWWLRGLEAGRADVLFVILIVWASDIGAYLVGRVVGGAKLAPSISPGKTWSGAVGGLVAAMLVGVAAARLMEGAAEGAGGVALLLGVASQAGDLFESWVKRRFGVKDSGRLIPGHGGLLDRLDGLLGAAPVAAGVAWMVGRGGALWT